METKVQWMLRVNYKDKPDMYKDFIKIIIKRNLYKM